MEDVIFARPVNWAEKASDHLGKSHPTGPSRILHKAFFLLVSEVFTHLAIVFHATALAVKLPACLTWQALDKMTSAKMRQLIHKTPEYLSWQNLKTAHIEPLRRSVTFSPLLRSMRSSSGQVFREMKQEILNQPKPSLSHSIWNVVSSRPFMITAMSVLGVATSYLLWTRYQNYQLAQQCHSEGDDWSISNWFTGQGSCSTERRERLARETHCVKTNGDWTGSDCNYARRDCVIDDGEWIEEKCDYQRRDCEKKGNDWFPPSKSNKGWCNGAQRLKREQEEKAIECERDGGLWISRQCDYSMYNCEKKGGTYVPNRFGLEWGGDCEFRKHKEKSPQPQPDDKLLQLKCPPIDQYPRVKKACLSGAPTRKDAFGELDDRLANQQRRKIASKLHPDSNKEYPDCGFFLDCINALGRGKK